MKVFSAIIFIFSFLFVPMGETTALAANPLGGAFGGKIIKVIPCICSASLMITVGPPVGGTFIYQPFSSILYKNYKPTPGSWVVGTATGTSTCYTGFPPYCTLFGTGSLIRKLGTS